MNRRAGIAAAVLVTGIFFVIRFGIRVLAHEAAPPASPVVVSRSPTSPVVLDTPMAPEEAKRDANTKLLVLSSEARASREPKAATLAYDAQRALAKDDCVAAQRALADAIESLSPGSSVKGAVESAQRSLSRYCATLRD